MSIGFNIRMVNNNDLPALQELYLNIADNKVVPLTSEKLKIWEEIIASPDYYILIGEDRGVIITSISMVIIRNITRDFSPYALIENVVVDEKYRRGEYTGLLLDRAVEIAKERGCYKVMITTGTRSEATLTMYEQRGFSGGDKRAFSMRLGNNH